MKFVVKMMWLKQHKQTETNFYNCENIWKEFTTINVEKEKHLTTNVQAAAAGCSTRGVSGKNNSVTQILQQCKGL